MNIQDIKKVCTRSLILSPTSVKINILANNLMWLRFRENAQTKSTNRNSFKDPKQNNNQKNIEYFGSPKVNSNGEKNNEKSQVQRMIMSDTAINYQALQKNSSSSNKLDRSSTQEIKTSQGIP